MRKAPHQVQVNYLAWKRIVELEGPRGLRVIKGFHDEALKGKLSGFRSSRLSKQWRVIYTMERDTFVIYVVEINPHSY
ncbi:MAG: type II toxin-antitoxin system mRNA interferase toxin, RelE/StbE family [bacterium]